MKFRLLQMLGLALFGAMAAAAPRTGLFADDRTLGDPKAPVVMVEYFAPSCPHCAWFAAHIFPEVKKDYIDTGKVLYVLRVFPLSGVDGAVAGLAKCLPPDKYYDFLDLAFRKQAMWDPDGYDIPDIHAAVVQLAGLAGLKPDQADRCMQDASEMDRINRIAEDGSARFGVHAVPTLIVDSQVLPEYEMNLIAIRARLDLAVAKAPPPVPAKPVVAKPHHRRHHHHHRHHHKKAVAPQKKR